MSNTINTIATFIVTQLQMLGAFAGDADIQMANEIGTLLGEADVNDLKIVLDGTDVAISFKSTPDAVEHLGEVAKTCGYSLRAAKPGYYLARRPLTKSVEIADSEPLNPAMAEALARAGLAAGKGEPEAAPQEQPKAEPQASAQPEAPAAQPAAAPSGNGFMSEAAMHARALSAQTAGMSTTTKVLLGVGGVAAVGGLALVGLKLAGVSVPFLDDDVEVPDVAAPVAAFFNFFSR